MSSPPRQTVRERREDLIAVVVNGDDEEAADANWRVLALDDALAGGQIAMDGPCPDDDGLGLLHE